MAAHVILNWQCVFGRYTVQNELEGKPSCPWLISAPRDSRSIPTFPPSNTTCPLHPRVCSTSLGPTCEKWCKCSRGGPNTPIVRFVTNNNERTSSVTATLKSLGWLSLRDRRWDTRLALMYNIVHVQVVVHTTTYFSRPTQELEPTINTSSTITLTRQRLTNIPLPPNCLTMEQPSCQGCGASTISADEPSLLVSYQALGWRTHPSA